MWTSSLMLIAVCAALHRCGGQEIQLDPKKISSPEITQANNPNAVSNLNRFTFHGNVMKTLGDNSASHWVVMFCPPWWEMCQRMVEPYSSMSVEWQGKLNSAVMTSDVRFASVDCATDKPLCNEQAVEGYPTVHHYSDGQRVATWNGGRQNDPESLSKWMKRQLGPLATTEGEKRVHSHTWDGVFLDAINTLKQLAPGDHALDSFLIIGILILLSRTICDNPMVWQTHVRKAHCLSHGAADCMKTRTVPDNSKMVPGEERVSGTRRFLPREWAIARQSIDL